MHILEIPSFFTPYGGEFCLEQAKALRGIGHEVRILSNVQLSVKRNVRDFFWTFPYGRQWHAREGIDVYQSYQRGIPKVVYLNVARWTDIVCSMFEDYICEYGRPDILHAHCAKWAGYAAMRIGSKHDIRYVITEHLSRLVFEDEFGLAPSRAWQIPFLKKAYKNASLVIPVSEELVDDISCYFGKDYQWRAVSNVIDTDFFHYHKRQERECRPFRFCCLANYIPLKGYDVLFAAFRKLRRKDASVELHIAGQGTDSRGCHSQLTENMFIYGQLDKEGVRNLLFHCDALVLASRSEVQPLVLMEAMSTGMPVVATEVTPKSLRIKEGCMIVPVDDVDALVLAMARVMEWPQTEGQGLSSQVAALASPSKVAMRLDRLFNEVLALS